MKYAALIRGINVGGKNITPMKKLQAVITDAGFINVTTYIQSGNVIFEAKVTGARSIAEKLENAILREFGCETGVVVLSAKQISEVVQNAPKNWHTSCDIRKYVAFVLPVISIPEVKVSITPREGIDEFEAGEGVLYMSTLLSGITKSGFSRLTGQKIYKYLTIRNYNTVCKLPELANAK